MTLTAGGARLMAEMQQGQEEFARLLFADLSPRLGGPHDVRTAIGERTVTGISFWADEPREVAALLRRPAAEGPPRRAAG